MKWVGIVLIILVFIGLFSFASITGIFSYMSALGFLPQFVVDATAGIGQAFTIMMSYSYVTLLVMILLVIFLLGWLLKKFLG